MTHPPLPIYMGTDDKASDRVNKLREIASALGYKTKRGSATGEAQGNISQLMQAIADGKVIIIQTPNN